MSQQLSTVILALCALAPASALIAGVTPLRMPASPPSTLRNIRADAPPPPQKGRLGATVDQDGKSNVWAVEPSVKVDREEKGIMQYAPVAGVAALALLLIPFLPALFAANPDQG